MEVSPQRRLHAEELASFRTLFLWGCGWFRVWIRRFCHGVWIGIFCTEKERKGKPLVIGHITPQGVYFNLVPGGILPMGEPCLKKLKTPLC